MAGYMYARTYERMRRVEFGKRFISSYVDIAILYYSSLFLLTSGSLWNILINSNSSHVSEIKSSGIFGSFLSTQSRHCNSCSLILDLGVFCLGFVYML